MRTVAASQAQVFTSKRDTWVTVVIVVALLALVLAFIPMTTAALARPSAWNWIGIAVSVVTFAIATSVLAGTKYILHPDRLDVRSGPFRWNVPTTDVLRITRTTDPSSAPALSLDRLLIQYRHGTTEREILISPRDQEAFMSAMRALSPHIEFF